MMIEEIFPCRSEETARALKSIANHIGCPEGIVCAMLPKSGVVWEAPGHLKAVGEATHAFNEAARYAGLLHRALTRLTEAQRKELLVAGCVTTFQVEHLKDVLAQDAEDLSSWSRDRLRTGGRNIAAYNVAELIRRVFRRTRKAITYGAAAGSSAPSTEFGQAVEFALGAFGLRAGWRGPAHEAWSKQKQINERCERICRRRPRSTDNIALPQAVVVTRVKEAHKDCFVLTIEGRPDIPAQEVCASTFASGAEVATYAHKWFNSLNTK